MSFAASLQLPDPWPPFPKPPPRPMSPPCPPLPAPPPPVSNPLFFPVALHAASARRSGSEVEVRNSDAARMGRLLWDREGAQYTRSRPIGDRISALLERVGSEEHLEQRDARCAS